MLATKGELVCQPMNNTGKLLLAHATRKFKCGTALGYDPESERQMRLFDRHGWVVLVQVVLGMSWPGSVLASPDTTIEGGTDNLAHEYRWTVTNTFSSPIVLVEFPHHNADLCLPPKGWAAKKNKDACIFHAPSLAEAIAPGRSAKFALRVKPKGARRGRGEVKVRFADGEGMVVTGVEVPESESVGDKFVPLIGMAMIFLVFIAAQIRRKRRSGSAAASDSSSTAT